ncbi:MAG: DUF58 domain-containing protein [Bacteroidales bacterium]|jgi:uncharacterized protein (DUF58 family)|nr:DUF58 domain-containing protein [Bacteroidales bacterium]
MDSNELIRKVRRIEIRTKALSHQIFQGQYHSAFKGLGMAFSEVRQYDYGDDVRFIDWNVTARFNQPYVKIFEEERELTVALLIDVSGSNKFGTRHELKADLITELAAVLSFSAIFNNDKVGVIFFSNKVEKFIPPKKGRSHILRIISELVSHEPTCIQTNVGEALRYLTNAIKKKCTAFVMSDFLDSGFEQAIRIAANKHDLVALNIMDRGEDAIPDLGLLNLSDPETGQFFLADTSSERFRAQYQQWWQQKRAKNSEIFKKAGVNAINLHTDRDYVKSLTEFFQARI